MSLLLMIHSYPGANKAVARHRPYYERAGADRIVGVGTAGDKCVWPDGIQEIQIGEDSYIMGDHLPRRLVNTLDWALSHTEYSEICVAEYDVIFLKPIPRGLTGFAAHLAGSGLYGARAKHFYHNPWLFDRETAWKIVTHGNQLIDAGEAEPSPDLFLGWLAEKHSIPVNTEWLSEHSRNSFDMLGHIEAARESVRGGVACVHGIKTKPELEFLLS